jgi:hypothetical protein
VEVVVVVVDLARQYKVLLDRAYLDKVILEVLHTITACHQDTEQVVVQVKQLAPLEKIVEPVVVEV